jgi:hypothetical protein
MDYLLIYEMSDDYLERRGEFRNQHLTLLWQAHDKGDLVIAGALANPPDGGVFHFRGDSPAAAEAFVKVDPYLKNGLIKKWEIREWTTVVGKDAANPIRPS